MISSVSSSYAPSVSLGSSLSTRSVNAQLAQLTSSDWDVISAAAGKTIGPDSYKPAGATADTAPILPAIAFSIARDRQTGVIASGSDVTSTYLQNWQGSGQSAEWNQEMARAIDYLQQKSGTDASALSAKTSGLDLLA